MRRKPFLHNIAQPYHHLGVLGSLMASTNDPVRTNLPCRCLLPGWSCLPITFKNYCDGPGSVRGITRLDALYFIRRMTGVSGIMRLRGGSRHRRQGSLGIFIKPTTFTINSLA
ncbi:hypothetical protein I7I48_11457 [Histoplasma ohiense]|nr:hypothetical protein I7I48_11457 [Histoplasma ohiense (nom. inval.)]